MMRWLDAGHGAPPDETLGDEIVENWGKWDRGLLTEHSEALLLPGDVLDLDHVVIESIFADRSDPLLGGSPHVSLSDPRVFEGGGGCWW